MEVPYWMNKKIEKPVLPENPSVPVEVPKKAEPHKKVDPPKKKSFLLISRVLALALALVIFVFAGMMLINSFKSKPTKFELLAEEYEKPREERVYKERSDLTIVTYTEDDINHYLIFDKDGNLIYPKSVSKESLENARASDK